MITKLHDLQQYSSLHICVNCIIFKGIHNFTQHKKKSTNHYKKGNKKREEGLPDIGSALFEE